MSPSFFSPPIVCNDSSADGESSLRMTFKCWHLNYVCLSEGEWPACFCCASFCVQDRRLQVLNAGGFILITRTHWYTHNASGIWSHGRNPEGAILDAFAEVRESVETVYTKNFNRFYFKRLPRKSHQIVTTNIKSLIVTNPRLYCQFICMAYFLVRTSTDTILWLKRSIPSQSMLTFRKHHTLRGDKNLHGGRFIVYQ